MFAMFFYYITDALKSKGVQCFYDNVRLASSVDVLFVCVLPAQIPLVAQEICPVISDSCFFYCISCGVKGKKLKQLFGLKNIIRPELNWLSEAPMPAWNNLLSVSLALEQKDLVERTCPIHLENEGIIYANTLHFTIRQSKIANPPTFWNCDIFRSIWHPLVGMKHVGEIQKVLRLSFLTREINSGLGY